LTAYTRQEQKYIMKEQPKSVGLLGVIVLLLQCTYRDITL